MKRLFAILFLALVMLTCKSSDIAQSNPKDDLIIAFGSCNKQFIDNILWQEIVKNDPEVWIWGGDNVYSDTDDMQKLKADYDQQMGQDGYSEILAKMKVLGTWDDHDYGLNDGGLEFHAKTESQELFLDFIGVSKEDPRRDREGVYHSEVINTKKGSVKIIVLDTRYFRSGLTPSQIKGRRYDPNPYGEGTILGKTQWRWLKQELNNSKADFNLIVSSIQVLSSEHGFETWGTMPHQRENLFNMIKNSSAKNVVLLSGDRHISEFSKLSIPGLNYPLIDFTSSGLTHSYSRFTKEPNQLREGEVVAEISFGLLKFNFDNKTITMEMRGAENVLQQELVQKFK